MNAGNFTVLKHRADMLEELSRGSCLSAITPLAHPLANAKASILLVDSVPHSRMMLAEVLRSLGVIQLHSARDANDGLSRIQALQPQVVFCELDMQPMDGFAFTSAVRRSLPAPVCATPIIGLSAQATIETVHTARTVGFNEFLLRPFTTGSVIARLEEVLLRPRRFIRSARYTGPCRRRKMVDERAPRRRLEDPTDWVELEDSSTIEPQKRAFHRHLEKISDLIAFLDPTDRAQVRKLHAGSKDTLLLAVDMRDVLLERAATSLVSYIEGIGANGGLDRAVIQTHLSAIHELVRRPRQITQERTIVAAGLEAIVAKKLSEMAA